MSILKINNIATSFIKKINGINKERIKKINGISTGFGIPAGSWVAKGDDTYWECDFPPIYCSYSGGWVYGQSGPSNWDMSGIVPIGGWQTGYRPTKMRITFTGSPSSHTITLRDTGLNFIYSGQCDNLAELTLNFSNNLDIDELAGFAINSAVTITNIEFFE